MIESRNNGDAKEKVETSKLSEFNPEEIFCNNDPNYKTELKF